MINHSIFTGNIDTLFTGNIDTSIKELADLIKSHEIYEDSFLNRDSYVFSFFPPEHSNIEGSLHRFQIEESLRRFQRLKFNVETAIQYDDEQKSTIKRVMAKCLEIIAGETWNKFEAKLVFCWLLDRFVNVAENDSDFDAAERVMITIMADKFKRKVLEI